MFLGGAAAGGAAGAAAPAVVTGKSNLKPPPLLTREGFDDWIKEITEFTALAQGHGLSDAEQVYRARQEIQGTLRKVATRKQPKDIAELKRVIETDIFPTKTRAILTHWLAIIRLKSDKRKIDESVDDFQELIDKIGAISIEELWGILLLLSFALPESQLKNISTIF